jgi:transcriptional regulator with XRE-family HTH domain
MRSPMRFSIRLKRFRSNESSPLSQTKSCSEHPLSTTSPDTIDPFETTATTFGGRLEAARNAKGLSVARLGEKLGVKASSIEIWESGADTPRSNRIQMLAGLLNVSIVWLITGDSNGSTNVAETHTRPTIINDTLGEITQLKATLLDAHAKLEGLEQRLRAES